VPIERADPCPTYRLPSPAGSTELVEAESCRAEGAMTVLRGTAYVMGRPREVVVRRVPRHGLVEEVLEEVTAESCGQAVVGRPWLTHWPPPAGRPTLERRRRLPRSRCSSEGRRPRQGVPSGVAADAVAVRV
jgi:hypothetical protein